MAIFLKKARLIILILMLTSVFSGLDISITAILTYTL